MCNECRGRLEWVYLNRFYFVCGFKNSTFPCFLFQVFLHLFVLGLEINLRHLILVLIVYFHSTHKCRLPEHVIILQTVDKKLRKKPTNEMKINLIGIEKARNTWPDYFGLWVFFLSQLSKSEKPYLLQQMTPFSVIQSVLEKRKPTHKGHRKGKRKVKSYDKARIDHVVASFPYLSFCVSSILKFSGLKCLPLTLSL